MTEFSFKKQPWSWRDPMHGLLHITSECVSVPLSVGHVCYKTWCDLTLSVDDVNAKTKVLADPTCLRCIVAEPKPDVIHGEE